MDIKLSFIFVLFSLSLSAQSSVDSINITLVRITPKKLVIKVSNTMSRNIYIMNREESNKRTYEYMTNCDTLNSSYYNKQINLPPSFFVKKYMKKVKFGNEKKIKFKLKSDYFEISKCNESEDAYFYFNLRFYYFDENEKLQIIGNKILNDKITIK